MAPRARRRKPRRTPTKDRMVVGVDEVREVFKMLPEEAQRTAVKDALEDSAEVVLAAMQRTVPRGPTGTLAASLQVFPVRKAKRRSSIRVGAGKEGYYGAFLEYGTSQMPARPWLRPALDSAFRATVAQFRETFGDEVEQAADRLADTAYGGV